MKSNIPVPNVPICKQHFSINHQHLNVLKLSRITNDFMQSPDPKISIALLAK